LKPCPFCGEAPVWYLIGNPDYIARRRTVVVKCTMCGTVQKTSIQKIPTKFAAMMAITKWNMRKGEEKKCQDQSDQ
jgi:Lar family restriction alleviation protein